jgi:CRP/FNR family transcriptional regulator, cyclic AMP receptor protein
MAWMDIFQHATDVVRFPAGAVVLEEGLPGDRMYVVKEGEVEVRHRGRVLARVGGGAIVGEMALIDHQSRSASVIAVTDVALVPVDEKRFLYLVQNTPKFALEVMRTLATRLRSLDERA